MNKIFSICFLMFLFSSANAQLTPYEKGGKNITATYSECIAYYQQLDKRSNIVQVKTMGPSDAGYPLHLVLVSKDGKFDPVAWHKQNKTVILINNGIHPGEPDGIDASMMLVRDIIDGKTALPNDVVLGIIPIYNIGGSLNRTKDYRVDQNGPEAFGSRGNSQNLDLNRDFIKCDSREARSFTEIFHFFDPDILVDNHVSNGADYQHVMTLISSQHNKLGGAMGEFMNKTFEPELFRMMKEKSYDLVPYVNFFGETPDAGWPEFVDGPRYASGYAALWHTFGFVPETHMLKPYPQRVDATYKLMECFIQFAKQHGSTIRRLREETKQKTAQQKLFTLDWTLDRTQSSQITFKGYTAAHKPSEVSGLSRLYYDRSKPYEKQIPFYNVYKPSLQAEAPQAFVVPQGWWKVIELLKANKVTMFPQKKDMEMVVETYKITDYKSAPRQYEGHHLNSEVKVDTLLTSVLVRAGDYLILMNQPANRFIMEVLDPRAPDSYFAWNFFDPILGAKEGYSSYVFEETAAELLANDPRLQQKLEARKQTDSAFAKSAGQQLNFVYQNSRYAEPGFMRYPVYRLTGNLIQFIKPVATNNEH